MLSRRDTLDISDGMQGPMAGVRSLAALFWLGQAASFFMRARWSTSIRVDISNVRHIHAHHEPDHKPLVARHTSGAVDAPGQMKSRSMPTITPFQMPT